MKRLVAALPLLALALLAVLFAVYSLNRDPNVKPDALVGRPLPRLVLPALGDGPALALSQTVAGPTYVNLFASWCGPCEFEHPQLRALQAAGARVVGVAYKDDPVKTRAFLQRLGDPFADIRVDRDGRAGIALGITGVPETYLVGADGVILAKHSGPLTPQVAAELEGRRRALTER